MSERDHVKSYKRTWNYYWNGSSRNGKGSCSGLIWLRIKTNGGILWMR